MSFGSFLIFCIVIAVWSTAGLFFFPAGLEHLEHGLKRAPGEGLFSALHRMPQTLRALRQERQDQHDQRLGELIEAALWLLGGVLAIFIGLFMLGGAMSLWKVLAVVLGLACFAGFWWLRRHYRQQRQLWRARGRDANPTRASEGGHLQAVILHLAGLVLLPIAGCLLVLSVFN